VTPPVVVSRVDPLFPVETSAKREVREVWLEGVVEADGTMSGLHVSMGINAEFNRRALEAASKWKFKPGTSKQTNQPVRAQVQLIVTFMPPQPAGAAATEEFGKGAHKQGEPGLVMPVVKKRVDPNYPKAAMKAKVQGDAAAWFGAVPSRDVTVTLVTSMSSNATGLVTRSGVSLSRPSGVRRRKTLGVR